jgi:hypothetical protein
MVVLVDYRLMSDVLFLVGGVFLVQHVWAHGNCLHGVLTFWVDGVDVVHWRSSNNVWSIVMLTLEVVEVLGSHVDIGLMVIDMHSLDSKLLPDRGMSVTHVDLKSGS